MYVNELSPSERLLQGYTARATDIFQNNFWESDRPLKEHSDSIWTTLLGLYVYNIEIFSCFFSFKFTRYYIIYVTV